MGFHFTNNRRTALGAIYNNEPKQCINEDKFARKCSYFTYFKTPPETVFYSYANIKI